MLPNLLPKIFKTTIYCVKNKKKPQNIVVFSFLVRMTGLEFGSKMQGKSTYFFVVSSQYLQKIPQNSYCFKRFLHFVTKIVTKITFLLPLRNCYQTVTKFCLIATKRQRLTLSPPSFFYSTTQ